MDFEGKVAIATGAASGMGLLFCQCFAAEGGNVLRCDINEEALAETAKEFAEAGCPAAACIAGNVASEESVEAMFKAVEEQFGYLDESGNSVKVYDMRSAEEILSEVRNRCG